MPDLLTAIHQIDLPDVVPCDENNRSTAFAIRFTADGDIPFPQVVLWEGGRQILLRDDAIRREDAGVYVATVPAGTLGPGAYDVQVEGCRTEDLEHAQPSDWIKAYAEVRVVPAQERADAPSPRIEVTKEAKPARGLGGDSDKKLYFTIHKHMHQPYYNTTDSGHWDGEKEEIFGSRAGPYTHFLPAAVRQYAEGGLPHAGLSASWSGSLIEQLDRARKEGFCGGAFSDWRRELRDVAQSTTERGHPRIDFSAFGFFHPLMPLIPARDIVRQIKMHRKKIKKTFETKASRILFPPETAFHVRMIPALCEAKVEAVIYDSIHRFRTCAGYPYAGPQEGMLPPNPSEQANPAATDWMQLHNIWAGSKIAPSLLKPEYVRYEDPAGNEYKIIAVPAERYIGNEDARGGFGALQYPDVLGQVRDHLLETGLYDEAHPPFFVLHSDGDNHGGGAESYYTHNTGQLVAWLQGDPRFELTTIRDYLDRFPPDPEAAVHLEPGSWSGADNGDPQFKKWFTHYEQPYSPDLNSWAVLTAFQNAVHTGEDAGADDDLIESVTRLLLLAETSCYWYWTGQAVWDAQVTNAANFGLGQLQGTLDQITGTGNDATGPTIFPPWVLPENPGGQTWGDGGLIDAPREGTVHTFVCDVSGVKRVTLTLRTESGETRMHMKDNGPYPSQTGPAATARFYTARLPVGAGDVRYWIEAEDEAGNVTRSALERVFLA